MKTIRVETDSVILYLKEEVLKYYTEDFIIDLWSKPKSNYTLKEDFDQETIVSYFHREDGPAVIITKGHSARPEYYWIHGNHMEPEEFNNWKYKQFDNKLHEVLGD